MKDKKAPFVFLTPFALPSLLKERWSFLLSLSFEHIVIHSVRDLSLYDEEERYYRPVESGILCSLFKSGFVFVSKHHPPLFLLCILGDLLACSPTSSLSSVLLPTTTVRPPLGQIQKKPFFCHLHRIHVRCLGRNRYQPINFSIPLPSSLQNYYRLETRTEGGLCARSPTV